MNPAEISQSPDELKELYKHALMVREKAYCPYSGHKVGAAIRTVEGKIYTGCNVENSSYGGTVCAERVAIQKAVSELGNVQLAEIMVVTNANPPWPPCGMCRQVIAEFSPRNQELTIYCANMEGHMLTSSFKELMPQAFTPTHLQS